MSQERLVFPIKIEGYGKITGIASWNTFTKHYRELVDAHQRSRRYIDALEAYLGAPDDPETEWDAFKAIQELKGEDCEHTDMVDAAIGAAEWVEWTNQKLKR